MIEVWKVIPLYPSYEASSLGRIRKLPFISANGKQRCRKIVSQCWQKGMFAHKQLVVNIFFGKRQHTIVAVARLVLMAHDRMPVGDEIARHLDDVPANNLVANLAWGTAQDNANDAIRNNRLARGAGINTSRLRLSDVLYIRKHGVKSRKPGQSNTGELARRFGVSTISILKVLDRITWTHV